MRARLTLSFLFALALPAAALAQPRPPEQPPPPTPPPAAPADLPPPPKVTDPKLVPVAQATHALRSWSEAVLIARNRSTDLRIARTEIERARGGARQALAGVLPSVNGQASVSRTLYDSEDGGGAPGGVSDPWSWRASVTATLPVIAPRAWHAIGTARRVERAAQLSVEDEERLILGGVAEAIVAVIVAERIAELNRDGLRSALETLELTRTRERLGAVSNLDVVRVRQDAAAARASVVTGDESLRQARDALGGALGHDAPWGVAPGFDLRALSLGLRNACTTTSDVTARADLAAARAQVEIAERAVTDVELGFAPTVDLSSTLGTGATGFGNSPATSWSISAVLSVPIWDGGARYGSLRSARAGVTATQQQYEAARRAASIEVSRARRGVDVAEESRAVSAEARDLAVETDRLAKIGYSAGRGTSLDLVQAAQQRRQAEIQVALREFDIVGAQISALLATSRCAP